MSWHNKGPASTQILFYLFEDRSLKRHSFADPVKGKAWGLCVAINLPTEKLFQTQ